jgi:hypothetical protein
MLTAKIEAFRLRVPFKPSSAAADAVSLTRTSLRSIRSPDGDPTLQVRHFAEAAAGIESIACFQKDTNGGSPATATVRICIQQRYPQ